MRAPLFWLSKNAAHEVITKDMAFFRGQAVARVPDDSPHSLVYLRKAMGKLLEVDAPDEDTWLYFLDEAGCEELSEVGKSLSPNQRTQALVCLQKFAASEDWNVRDSVARVLGAMDGQVVESTLRVLSNDSNDMVRRSVLKGLMALDHESS